MDYNAPQSIQMLPPIAYQIEDTRKKIPYVGNLSFLFDKKLEAILFLQQNTLRNLTTNSLQINNNNNIPRIPPAPNSNLRLNLAIFREHKKTRKNQILKKLETTNDKIIYMKRHRYGMGHRNTRLYC